MKKKFAIVGVLLGFFALLTAASNGEWLRTGNVKILGNLKVGSLQYIGATGTNLLTIPDSLASAYLIEDANGNDQIKINTSSNTITVTPDTTVSGTLASGALTVTGAASATTTVSAGTYYIDGTSAAVTAAGTAKTDCTALTKGFNLVGTATSLQGVCLPAAVAGEGVKVENGTAVSIIIYPKDSDNATLRIHPLAALAADAGWVIGPGGSLSCRAVSATSWLCDQTLGVTATVSAANSGQSGTALVAVNLGSHVLVDSADDTKSITLPTGSNLGCIRIYNSVYNKILPVLGHNSDNDTINGGSADGAVNWGPGVSNLVCTVDGVAWVVY